MVMPPKLTDIKKEDSEEAEPSQDVITEAYGQRVRHVIRGINAQGLHGDDGSEPLSVVENYLDSILMQGYRLFYVQHLRSNYAPEGNTVLSEQMLYVFVKE